MCKRVTRVKPAPAGTHSLTNRDRDLGSFPDKALLSRSTSGIVMLSLSLLLMSLCLIEGLGLHLERHSKEPNLRPLRESISRPFCKLLVLHLCLARTERDHVVLSDQNRVRTVSTTA